MCNLPWRRDNTHLTCPTCLRALTWPVRVVVPAVCDEGGQAGAPVLALQQVTVVHVVVGGGAGLYRAVGPAGRGGDGGGGGVIILEVVVSGVIYGNGDGASEQW